MVVHVDVAPDMLRWAADRAGWDADTDNEHARRLFAWTSGEKRPTLKQLESFANATHTPFGLLFLPEPPVESVPIPDFRTVRNTTLTQPSVDLLDTISLCKSRQDWYREYMEENGADGPQFIGSADTAAPVVHVAEEIRNSLRFEMHRRANFSTWQDALRALVDGIEELGVLVMINGVVGANTHRALNPEEFRGFALSDAMAPLIFVNGADTKAAQIFTLIHELAHLWLGVSALSDADMGRQGSNAEEQWCNQVAAEVLVPVASLRSEFKGRISTEELDRLAKYFKVSTLVVLKKIYDSRFLSWSQYQNAYKEEQQRIFGFLEAKNKSSGGNYYNTQRLRLSQQFARAVITSALEGSTSYREAYHLLGMKKHSTFKKMAENLGVA